MVSRCQVLPFLQEQRRSCLVESPACEMPHSVPQRIATGHTDAPSTPPFPGELFLWTSLCRFSSVSIYSFFLTLGKLACFYCFLVSVFCCRPGCTLNMFQCAASCFVSEYIFIRNLESALFCLLATVASPSHHGIHPLNNLHGLSDKIGVHGRTRTFVH